MKIVLALLVAGTLAACQSTGGNKITITTNDGQQVAMEDASVPSTAREAVVMAKIDR